MSTEKKKDSKSCNRKSKAMLSYGIIQLSSSIISAFSLAFIALGFCSINKEAKVFNSCVQEIEASGKTVSSSVRYCNGGN